MAPCRSSTSVWSALLLAREARKMACSVVRSPVLRNPTVRHYAAAVAAQRSCAAAPETQVLSNKIAVATVDNNNPVTQVSIVFRAGSRNETYDTQGLVHHLRIATGLGTCNSSSFGIISTIQQLGGTITTTTDRESIAYTLQVTRNHLDKALPVLEQVATQQLFKPWEVSDQIPRLRYELSTIPETTRLMELLHKAAYQDGLGYSLYCPKRQLGKLNMESLQHFVNNWFTGSRCAVVATGVPLSDLSSFAASLKVGTEDKAAQAAKYHGGEMRKERTSELSSVAVAVEAIGFNDRKNALVCAILQRAVGSGPRVKWGAGVSPLHKAVSSAGSADQFAISAYNAVYSDSSLYGFVLSTVPSLAGSLTKAATAYLRSPQLSDADVARGKALLKAEIAFVADNDAATLENMGVQLLFMGKMYNTPKFIEEVDKITASEVKSVAAKIGGGKLSMAAIGDLATVPYIEELK
ncbi:hypothetical protein DMN91_003930 [Ooceraea biroi]|uniref:Cytochrome b-c1 complex subunit 2, mitochondrial n=1 Tax=Ooceraea biroi TaxID=2015173 RepID=A0A026X2Y1_OOCBI|nr:cytochrome b-c1 complex subunit 2, mitochondrial [Ooceraea biroi]EZA62468.1 Cytochrome b-c1 complex subunit 2, mitochondrial [Ooceraea biroi]RLU23724.1 hypothetical protein DMN91_003930 [Ooceraea biroi]